MHRERSFALAAISMAFDVILIASSFLLAYYIKGHFLPTQWQSLHPIEFYGWEVLGLIVFTIVALYFSGFYTFGRTISIVDILLGVPKAVGFSTALLIIAMFVFKAQGKPRWLIGLFGLVTCIVLMLFKVIFRNFTSKLQEHGYNVINALVLGTGPKAQWLMQSIQSHPELGYRVVGVLAEDEIRKTDEVSGVKVLGLINDLEELLTKSSVDEVFAAVPQYEIQDIGRWVYACELVGIRFSVVTDWIDTVIAHKSIRFFFDTPLLTYSATPQQVGQLIIKAIIDRVLSAIALIALAPFFLMFSIIIKLTSPGPVFFTQKRAGMNGRIFDLIKFRTMVVGAEEMKKELEAYNEMTGPVFKMKDDPRVTKIGRWMRKYSIDELPQLINVLKGEMSLVGPRPPLPEEVGKYEQWQRRRLSMKPGVTCFWQISGRNKISFGEWMKMDLKYIDNWSLKLDLIILLKTIPVVFSGRGAS